MIRSVAYLSMHTSPLAQPGTGYAGGMNVYVHELAQTMADRDVDVVVFTRRTAADQPDVVRHRPHYRVVHIGAGPAAELRVSAQHPHVGDFASGVISWMHRPGAGFDVIHSHYWLSGWAGVLVKESTGNPLINSFHTLGRVKEMARRDDESPAPPIRTLTEEEVIKRSDAVVASTGYEVEDLVAHYGARRERLHVSPPGIDHIVFNPGDCGPAREWLGLHDEPLILYAGRIDAHKGIDVALEAVAKLPEHVAIGTGPPHLIVAGGPGGQRGKSELAFLRARIRDLGLSDRVHFVGAQPHPALSNYYRAANVLIMPSRSESFGLVAAEAQACGLPVVASNVGGLRFVVEHGTSGFVVDDLSPAAFADAVLGVLDDPVRAERLAAGAVANAEKFSWRATAQRLLDLYASVTGPSPVSRSVADNPRKNPLRNL